MAGSAEVYSSGVSDVTDFSSESGRSYDTLDELLSRFTLEFKPEYVIKFRNRCGGMGALAVRHCRTAQSHFMIEPEASSSSHLDPLFVD
jgi:hypothetical protein